MIRRDLDLAALVHEVRSPVAALAAIEAALREPLLELVARRRLVELALAACRGIDRLVRDATLASVSLETIDVVRLVEDVAAAASLTAPVPVHVYGEHTLALRADPQRVRQALDNLMRNAVAVSPPDAPVVIRVEDAAGYAYISVSDTGPGVPPAERERIFEPGARLDDARPGSGLGLAIARAIAEAHGGTLSVESAVGEGSVFTLTLPLDPLSRRPELRARTSGGGDPRRRAR